MLQVHLWHEATQLVSKLISKAGTTLIAGDKSGQVLDILQHLKTEQGQRF